MLSFLPLTMKRYRNLPSRVSEKFLEISGKETVDPKTHVVLDVISIVDTIVKYATIEMWIRSL